MYRIRKSGIVALVLLVIISIAVISSLNSSKDSTKEIFLTEEEVAWLNEHKDEIKIGYTTDYPPVEFIKSGKYVGMSADYFKLLQEKLGISIEMVEFDNFDELIRQAKDREITGITAATKTLERSEYLDFTIPYIDNPNVIITRKNFSEKLTFEKLANTSMDILVIEGYDIIEFLNEKFPKLEYRTVKSPSNGIRMVAFGEADAMIIEVMSATAEIDRDNISNLMVNVETPYESSLSIATRNDWPIISQIFNKGLAQISNSEKRAIEQKWITLQKAGILQNRIFWYGVLGLLLILIVIIIVIAIWNSTLKVAVKEKTKELEESKKELMFKTYHDELTGLHNRVYMGEILENLKEDKSLPFSIILADLNGLKITNDTFGHEAGDRMLIKVAQIIKENIGAQHIACRIGGDEIIIIMPHTSEGQCIEILDNIRKATLNAEEDPIKPLVALGHVTSYNIHYEFTSLFKLAENKMYANKMENSELDHDRIISAIKNKLYKSKYESKEHHERLIAMSKEISNFVNLEKYVKESLVLLAELHDIGKVSTDERILTKKSSLTREEWEIVKRHSELGFKIVSGSKKLSHIGKGILGLHERWDGSGYPQGLKGEEIPYIARLLSIIEAYDVMTHQRPYKPTLSEDEALEEIKENSGSQFDPELVKMFVEYIRCKEY